MRFLRPLVHHVMMYSMMVAAPVVAFVPHSSSRAIVTATTPCETSLCLLQDRKQEPQQENGGNTRNSNDLEETTQKFGLEVGLTQALLKQKEDGGATAKSLLKKYGIAYLATSIPLALISFSLCYILVDQGVNVSELLAKVGIETANNAAADQAGTVALAYAAHKAASPIRFPPTVLLTPIVAKWIGKEPSTTEGDE